MADIALRLPDDEAMALAQLVKRVDYDRILLFASTRATYGDRSEADTMWAGVLLLQRQLAEAGFDPR